MSSWSGGNWGVLDPSSRPRTLPSASGQLNDGGPPKPLPGDAIVSQADKARVRFAQAVEQVQGDHTLNDDTRRQRLAKAWIAVRDDVVGLRREWNDSFGSEVRKLERRVFSLPTSMLGSSPEERLAAESSYRSAFAMADAVDREDREGLVALMRRAQRTGDESLARAVCMIALERNQVAPANMWLEDHPEVEADLAEIQRLTSYAGDSAVRFASSMAFSAPSKPAEISAMADWAIEELASGTGSAA